MKIKWLKMILAALWTAGSITLPASCVLTSYAAEQTPPEDHLFDYSASPVGMDVSSGFDGAAKGGRYVPVKVELDNQQDVAFQGSVRILSREADRDIYRYDYPVTLKPNQLETLELNIPLGGRADQLFAALCDESGTELVKKRIKLNVSVEVSELFIGILSDTPEQLQYLDRVGVHYSAIRTRTFQLSAGALPEDEAGLDQLDAILITNYDTKKITAGQVRAIMNWVQKGGLLLIGTGSRVSDTMAAFQKDLIDEPYGIPDIKQVNMGVEYAVNGPGDSYIEIPCSQVSLSDGKEILSSDDFTVLTAAVRGKGIVAVAAYDFVDIAQFCQTQISYIDKLFTELLGEDKINVLANEVYNGNSDEYWSIQNMINTGDVEKLPNLFLYITAVLVYIILVGPGFYLLLKHQERRRYYRTGIVLISLIFTAVIYMMGSKTRFKDTFFSYATIHDVDSDIAKEYTYINVRTPYNKPYTVYLNPDYEIRPVTGSYYYSSDPLPRFRGNEDYQVNIEKEEAKTRLSVQHVASFSPKYFYMQKERENSGNLGLTGDIRLFNGQISGSVTNHFDYQLENVALLMGGHMVLLDTLEAGQTKKLDGLKVLNYPMNYYYMVSERISGGYRYTKADISDKDYLLTLYRTNVLNFYLYNSSSGYGAEARIVAFSRDQSQNSFLLEDRYETYGINMFTSPVEVDSMQGGFIYRTASVKKAVSSGGQYFAPSNSVYGTAPVVLEYSLGNDIEVEKVLFEKISDEFLNEDKYGNITLFKGNIYFYNHDTGIYDQVDPEQNEFTYQELTSYLSPGNTFTVKYVGESSDEYNWNMLLPMPAVIGKEK